MMMKGKATKATKAKKPRRLGLAESERIRQYHLGRRLAKPLVLTGLPKPQLRTFGVVELDRLQIDERYQRIRVTTWVNTLTHVLLQGGDFPSPIVVSKRPDGSLYIVDGQQRWWAAGEAKRPLPAYVYELGADFIEAERKLFTILNHQKSVRSNTIVHAWVGEIGDLIRKSDTTPDHPMFGKINLGNNASRPFAAAVLVRALVATLGAAPGMLGIHELCGMADTLLARPEARERADGALRLLAAVFGTARASRLHVHIALAFGKIIASRWADGVAMPPAGVLERLRRVNWTTIVPTAEKKYESVLLGEIGRLWK